MRELYYFIYGHPKLVIQILLVIVCVLGVWECINRICFSNNSFLKVLWKAAIFSELIGCLLLFLYASLLNRSDSGIVNYELNLFWSYKRVIENPSSYLKYQILFNILAFIPMGNAINYILEHKRKWIYAVLICLGLSLLVEVIQLVFHLGLFEFDDMFDNVLGGIIGYMIAEIFRGITGFIKKKCECKK